MKTIWASDYSSWKSNAMEHFIGWSEILYLKWKTYNWHLTFRFFFLLSLFISQLAPCFVLLIQHSPFLPLMRIPLVSVPSLSHWTLHSLSTGVCPHFIPMSPKLARSRNTLKSFLRKFSLDLGTFFLLRSPAKMTINISARFTPLKIH